MPLAALMALMLLLTPILLISPAASAPIKAVRSLQEMGSIALSSAPAGASRLSVAYPCWMEGFVKDLLTGAPLKGAEVTCIREDGEERDRWTAATSSSGRFRLELPEGSYSWIATHSAHIMKSQSEPIRLKAPYTKRVRGAGGILREVTISSERSRTVNISLSARPSVVLLATTSLLSSTAELEEAVGRYSEVISRREGLSASFVVLDSEECLESFGLRVDDPANWLEIRNVLAAISEHTGPCYIILLGGPDVVPMPEMVSMGTGFWYLPSDGWYIDFDGDGVVDEGFSISRMADVSVQSSAVAAALSTAADVHQAGGFGIYPETRLSTQCWYPEPVGLGEACREGDAICGSCYATPPYGICDECDRKEELFRRLSESDYIFFMGHGSPQSFATNDMIPKFNLDNLSEVDLSSNHPVILAYVSCDTAQLRSDRPTFATELLRAGAVAYVGRTQEEGTPAVFTESFEIYLKGKSPSGSYRIGDALSELLRQSVLVNGAVDKRAALQVCMYGDPTLKKSDNELYILPAMTSIANLSVSGSRR